MIYIIIIFIVIFFIIINKKYKENFQEILELKKVSEPQELQKGLMFVKKLDKNKGMLFDFKKTKKNSIWMKNTYIPLDVLFLDENYKILGFIENTEPLSLKSISIDNESRYVVELNAGTVKDYNIKENEILQFKEISSL